MTKPERTISLLLLIAGSLALAAPSFAHKTDQFHFHIDPIVFEVLDVDVDTNSSKFNEYRDIQSGFNLPELRIFGETPDGNRTLELRAEHVLRDDARYELEYDVAGTWGLLVDYNKIPHLFGNDGTLMWEQTRPGVLELPDTMQSFIQTAIAGAGSAGTSFNFLNALLQPFLATADSVDLGLQRDRTHARVDVKKMHRFGVSVDVQHESRNGIRPYAGSFGFSNSIELFEPIDYETTHAVMSAETTTKRGGLRVGYRNSNFDNDTTTLFWDNWMRATDVSGGPAHGFSDLAPDNDSGLFFLEGRYGFGRGWRISGDVGYNVMEQDDPLLPYTINTALVGIDHETGATFNPTLAANLPVSSADAEADVLNFDVNVSKKFFDDLTLKLLYRYYDYDNQTPRVVFDGFAVFHSTWTAEPRVTVPFAFTRDDLGAELDWELTERTNLGFTYHLKGYDREFREVESSDEDVFKLSFDTKPSERFTIRASYEFGDRTIDDYLEEAGFSFLEDHDTGNHARTAQVRRGSPRVRRLGGVGVRLPYRGLEPQSRDLRTRRGLRREPVRSDQRRDPAVQRRPFLRAERDVRLVSLRPLRRSRELPARPPVGGDALDRPARRLDGRPRRVDRHRGPGIQRLAHRSLAVGYQRELVEVGWRRGLRISPRRDGNFGRVEGAGRLRQLRGHRAPGARSPDRLQHQPAHRRGLALPLRGLHHRQLQPAGAAALSAVDAVAGGQRRRLPGRRLRCQLQAELVASVLRN